ncbi:MAG: hypothetical protein B0D92_06645 [Spirochaeta sp. LUC14_002_19_P3]|nr:MAG: hypothetical protein B0D92_06645 [Spirochaeta sp. LUC14_002_19_P3]
MSIIKDKELSNLIQSDLRDFISLSSALTVMDPWSVPRAFIGRMHLEASKCEEMLDAYGAPRNKYWSPVRLAMATAKAFSQVVYNLFHLQYLMPSHNILAIEGNFPDATLETLDKLLLAMSASAKSFMDLIGKMKIDINIKPIEDYDFHRMPTLHGVLEANQKRKNVQDPQKTAVHLATRMLVLAEKSNWLNVYKTTDSNQYFNSIPSIVSEARLRSLANKFHSLQSQYDTYLSGSNIAEKDKMLPVMRGNLSVVFHLLDTAVTLIHFYERHSSKNWLHELKAPLSNKALLEILIDYFIAYSNRIIEAAQNLCKDVLRSYAVQGEIEVPIPNYRGFHVRPSTLIAKIVFHYGSEVKMLYENVTYDASLPMELFRANEEINRRKRDTVIQHIMEHKLMEKESVLKKSESRNTARIIFFDLLNQQKIMLYNNDLSFEDIIPYSEETLPEYVRRVITRCLAEGKIDIVCGDTVVFKGDKRVLEDIKILAECGYGEDKFGNNIVLPKQLSYLRH